MLIIFCVQKCIVYILCLFHEHSNIILGYVSGKQWKCRFTKIDTSPVKMSLEKILCKMWYVSNSFRPKIFSKHQINVWWLSFSTRNTQGTFYNLFREHPTIILEYMSRNVWSCEFLGFQHPIFDASFDDILKIKDLQIFKIQRSLEKKSIHPMKKWFALKTTQCWWTLQ